MKYHYEIIPTDEHLPIRFFYSNEQRKTQIPPHLHDYIEILYLLTGSLTVVVNGKSICLKPDNMVMIHPNHIHSTASGDSSTTAYVLQVSYSFLERYCPDCELIRFDSLLNEHTDFHHKLSEVRTILHEFYLLQTDSDTHCHLKRTSLLYDIIYLFARFFASEKQAHTGSLRPDTCTKLADIIRYINFHFQEELSLKETAHTIGLSPTYLSRFFKKYIGINFSEYIDIIRLDYAYHLVTASKTPILKISEECGFANYPMFVKKFQRTYGKTPSKLRQGYQVF